MRNFIRRMLAPVVAAALLLPATASGQEIADAYRDVADRIIDAATGDHDAYARLTELVETFGPRISGSVALERAIDDRGGQRRARPYIASQLRRLRD